MTIFRDFQGSRPRRDIGIARPRRDRDTQKRVSRPRHVSRNPALLANQIQTTSSYENFTYKFQNNLQSVSQQLHQQLNHCTYKKMEFNAPFIMKDLEQALAKSNNSAVGNDKLNCEMLKHMPYHCLQILLLLFNRIWFTGEIPSEWLHSVVVPVYKPNKPANLPQSYRPILLTSHICKIMERMVAVRLRW